MGKNWKRDTSKLCSLFHDEITVIRNIRLIRLQWISLYHRSLHKGNWSPWSNCWAWMECLAPHICHPSSWGYCSSSPISCQEPLCLLQAAWLRKSSFMRRSSSMLHRKPMGRSPSRWSWGQSRTPTRSCANGSQLGPRWLEPALGMSSPYRSSKCLGSNHSQRSTLLYLQPADGYHQCTWRFSWTIFGSDVQPCLLHILQAPLEALSRTESPWCSWQKARTWAVLREEE